jgi:chitodextrinase
MNQKLTSYLAAALALLLTGPAAVAHHSESAQFDTTKPVEVTGVVKKVEWTNPHIWYFVDVKDESGKVTTWGFSGGAPGMLARRGFTKNTLKVGDVVTVRGSRARDGSNNASGGRVTFADGRQVFANALEFGREQAQGTARP